MSFGQKVGFLSTYLGNVNKHYDNARLGDGALTEDLPLWVPGPERKVITTFRQPLGDYFYIQAEGEKSIDFKEQQQLMISTGGRF